MSTLSTIGGLIKNKITQPFKTKELVSKVARKYKLREYPMGAVNQKKAYKKMKEFANKGDMKGMRDYAQDQQNKIYN